MTDITWEKVKCLLLYPVLQTEIPGPFLNLLICPIDEATRNSLTE